MSLNLYFIICVLSIFQILILTTIVRVKSNWKTRANKTFAFFLLLNAVLLFLSAINSGYSLNYVLTVIFTILSISFLLLLGPIFYLLFKQVLNRKQKNIGSNFYFHFIPTIISFIVLGVLLIIELSQEIPDFNLFQFIYKAFLIFFISQLVFYIYLSYKSLLNYKLALISQKSSFSRNSLNWLRLLLVIYFLHWIFEALTISLDLLKLTSISQSLWLANIAIIFLLIFLTLSVIRSAQGFNIIKVENNLSKYIDSNLSNEKKERFQKELIEFMDKEKPFLNPDLTINQLAKSIDIPVKNVSQIINESFQSNFFDFINQFRIEMAKSMLNNDIKNSKSLTIQQIFYDVGFNSKSAFNRAFKKNTQMTPSQFRQLKSTNDTQL